MRTPGPCRPRPLRNPGVSGRLQVGRHHVRLAVANLERDDRHRVGLRPRLHVRPELVADPFEQRRGRDRVAPVVVQEVDHPARGLQLGHEPGQVEPVQVGDIQPDVTGHLCAAVTTDDPTPADPEPVTSIVPGSGSMTPGSAHRNRSDQPDHPPRRSEAEPLWMIDSKGSVVVVATRERRSRSSWPFEGLIDRLDGLPQRFEHGGAGAFGVRLCELGAAAATRPGSTRPRTRGRSSSCPR
jgi:hypothetical protein